MTTLDHALRENYQRLVNLLMVTGTQQQALACAKLAVQQGLWRHPLQRPVTYNPSLAPRSSYEPSAFWVARYLEEHFPAIREEVDAVVASGHHGFRPVDEPLVNHGRWDQVIFYEGGHRFDNACRRFPEIASLLDKIPPKFLHTGVVSLSWLYPNTHIVPHNGDTNLRLRLHLGIRVPPNCMIRVGEEILQWKEGKCIVFDDSFEHEVWQNGASERIVLLFDLPHPDLPEKEQGTTLPKSSRINQLVRAFLQERGLRGIRRESNRIVLLPDAETDKTIRRYMEDSQFQAVERAGNGLRFEKSETPEPGSQRGEAGTEATSAPVQEPAAREDVFGDFIP